MSDLRNRTIAIWVSCIALNSGLTEVTSIAQVAKEDAIAIELLVDRLVTEAETGWLRNDNWPRREPSFAGEFDLVLAGDEIISALGRSLHNDVAMDGYIKWQLLSFNPKIDLMSTKLAKSVVAALPRIIPQPSPIDRLPRKKTRIKAASFVLKGQHPPFIPPLSPIFADRGLYHLKHQSTIISSGAAVGGVGQTKERPLHIDMRDHERLTEVVEQGNEQLLKLRRIVQDANRPAILYRNAVIKQLPQRGGIRLGAMYQDMADRIHAGEATHAEAAYRFVRECAARTRDRSVKSSLRKRLISELRNLHRVRVDVTRSVTTIEVNRFRVDIDEVGLSDENLNAAIDALKGKAK